MIPNSNGLGIKALKIKDHRESCASLAFLTGDGRGFTVIKAWHLRLVALDDPPCQGFDFACVDATHFEVSAIKTPRFYAFPPGAHTGKGMAIKDRDFLFGI